MSFVPLLEENGLIVDVGAWALRQARHDHSRWFEQRLAAPRVAANVSVVQLQRDDFVRTVSGIVNMAGTAAGLDIEVTETLRLSDVDENLSKLNALRAPGCGRRAGRFRYWLFHIGVSGEASRTDTEDRPVISRIHAR